LTAIAKLTTGLTNFSQLVEPIHDGTVEIDVKAVRFVIEMARLLFNCMSDYRADISVMPAILYHRSSP
jgi:hypothetical protein